MKYCNKRFPDPENRPHPVRPQSKKTIATRAASVHIDHRPTDLQIQSKYSISPVNVLSF